MPKFDTSFNFGANALRKSRNKGTSRKKGGGGKKKGGGKKGGSFGS